MIGTCFFQDAEDIQKDLNSLYNRMKELRYYTAYTPDKTSIEKEVVQIFRILFEEYEKRGKSLTQGERTTLNTLVKVTAIFILTLPF